MQVHRRQCMTTPDIIMSTHLGQRKYVLASTLQYVQMIACSHNPGPKQNKGFDAKAAKASVAACWIQAFARVQRCPCDPVVTA